VLLLHDMADRGSKLVYFTGIDKARFRRPVVPGDQIRFELEVLKLRARTCKMRGRATVEGELAAEAEILSALVDRPGS
jgi:3-hydroxymyristoyl/3-hydroxydecanoyl-(acyl carrier protein) dehydratase